MPSIKIGSSDLIVCLGMMTKSPTILSLTLQESPVRSARPATATSPPKYVFGTAITRQPRLRSAQLYLSICSFRIGANISPVSIVPNKSEPPAVATGFRCQHLLLVSRNDCRSDVCGALACPAERAGTRSLPLPVLTSRLKRIQKRPHHPDAVLDLRIVAVMPPRRDLGIRPLYRSRRRGTRMSTPSVLRNSFCSFSTSLIVRRQNSGVTRVRRSSVLYRVRATGTTAVLTTFG